MATVQILYWSDIPVQVRANEGRDRASCPLSERFQEAVDAATMAAGLIGSDAYTEQFRWSEPKTQEGTPKAVVAAVADALEADFASIDWRQTAETLRVQRGD